MLPSTQTAAPAPAAAVPVPIRGAVIMPYFIMEVRAALPIAPVKIALIAIFAAAPPPIESGGESIPRPFYARTGRRKTPVRGRRSGVIAQIVPAAGAALPPLASPFVTAKSFDFAFILPPEVAYEIPPLTGRIAGRPDVSTDYDDVQTENEEA